MNEMIFVLWTLALVAIGCCAVALTARLGRRCVADAMHEGLKSEVQKLSVQPGNVLVLRRPEAYVALFEDELRSADVLRVAALAAHVVIVPHGTTFEVLTEEQVQELLGGPADRPQPGGPSDGAPGLVNEPMRSA